MTTGCPSLQDAEYAFLSRWLAALLMRNQVHLAMVIASITVVVAIAAARGRARGREGEGAEGLERELHWH